MKANNIKISLAVLSVLLLGATLLAGCYVFLGEDPPDPSYVPVQGIYGVPTGAVKGSDLQFKVTVYPANATNQIITWSVANDGGTGSSIDRNILTPTASGIVTVNATIAGGGATRAQDYTQSFNIEILNVYYKVTNIANVPTECAIGEPLTLPSGTEPGVVRPSNANNKTITWALKSAGGTGAMLEGHTLKGTTTDGTITVTATVQNGKSPSEDYTQDFIITVKPPVPIVYVVGSTDLGGCYWEIDTETNVKTLNPIADSRYFYGIAIESGTLYITGCDAPGGDDNLYLWVIETGKVPARHLIENVAYPSDYNSIVVSNGKVYIAGYFNDGYGWVPAYWEWDTDTEAVTERVDLWYSETESWYGAYPTGIAVSGSKVYVSGYSDLYGTEIACYWTGAGQTNYHQLAGSSDLDDQGYDYSTSGVAVMGNNVYIAGGGGDYWSSNNNGATFTYHPGEEVDDDDNWTYIGLPIPSDYNPNIYAITARDGKWYAAGQYTDGNGWYACYWENGQYKALNSEGGANAIAVQQGNVYVTGWSDTSDAVYWVNSDPYQTLPMGGASWANIYGIAVGWR